MTKNRPYSQTDWNMQWVKVRPLSHSAFTVSNNIAANYFHYPTHTHHSTVVALKLYSQSRQEPERTLNLKFLCVCYDGWFSAIQKVPLYLYWAYNTLCPCPYSSISSAVFNCPTQSFHNVTLYSRFESIYFLSSLSIHH